MEARSAVGRAWWDTFANFPSSFMCFLSYSFICRLGAKLDGSRKKSVWKTTIYQFNRTDFVWTKLRVTGSLLNYYISPILEVFNCFNYYFILWKYFLLVCFLISFHSSSHSRFSCCVLQNCAELRYQFSMTWWNVSWGRKAWLPWYVHYVYSDFVYVLARKPLICSV